MYMTSLSYCLTWIKCHWHINGILKCCDYQKKKKKSQSARRSYNKTNRNVKRCRVCQLEDVSINIEFSGQIFHTQLLSVILSMDGWRVGRWCSWLFPVGEWQIRGGRSQWGWGEVRSSVNTSRWIPLHLPSPARDNVIFKKNSKIQ